MTEEETQGAQHERAVCPDCGMLNVTVQTAPRKPPRMYCTACNWDSLSGGASS